MTSLTNPSVLSHATAEAAKAGNSAEVSRALDAGLDVNAGDSNGTALLHYAAATGHLDIAQLLLDRGANANAEAKYGMTPLLFAVQSNHLELVELLVDAGADLNAKDHQASHSVLDWARELGHDAVAEFLLARGAKNADPLPENLIGAARAGDLDEVRKHISAGLDVNARLDSLSLLHWVASAGNVSVAQFLIRQGASVDAINKNGITPLIAAALQGHPNIVRLLLDANADPNRVAENELTALGAAKSNGHVEIRKMLEEGGAAF